jgi:hypothetical protein
MSGVYWGIVFGLLTMVATLFICVGILYSHPNGSPNMLSDELDEPGQAIAPPSAAPRKAA